MDDRIQIIFKRCEKSFANEWVDPTFPSLARYMDNED